MVMLALHGRKEILSYLGGVLFMFDRIEPNALYKEAFLHIEKNKMSCYESSKDAFSIFIYLCVILLG